MSCITCDGVFYVLKIRQKYIVLLIRQKKNNITLILQRQIINILRP